MRLCVLDACLAKHQLKPCFCTRLQSARQPLQSEAGKLYQMHSKEQCSCAGWVPGMPNISSSCTAALDHGMHGSPCLQKPVHAAHRALWAHLKRSMG